MRTIILLLSLLVVLLAVLILRSRPAPALADAVFPASRLIADAQAGESATYRDETGETLTLWVEMVRPGGLERPPWIRVRSVWRDRDGRPLPEGTHVYNHDPTRHGLFPLVAPADPEGHDRVWVWSRIRRATLPWQGEARALWRVDLIDPALPAAGNADHVVAWVDPAIPVFGLLRWQRYGRTWSLVEWSPR